ncbi:MAG TPA: helix-turn-helix transcriptional regulator [Candidatus Merdicola faecigallinarum]|uniref:Helix-turn-helix transcriptional regulator n=1 Tax=Candidatus Merdicola faecigallinarum TaxID=2840862 RepID=A0A9D1M1Q9_9FIRM|nr:helix-turn-helix transcriptional regulator [Candidatus Merdicola faecigallinarum]
MKMRSIGETIASLRKEKGMTQNELAEKMNVTDKAVSKWERDLSCPDVNTISKLADILEVSVEELLKAKKKDNLEMKTKDLMNLIFKAVALAMGIAAVTLNILNQIAVKSSIIMLGIGIICISIYLLTNKENKN